MTPPTSPRGGAGAERLRPRARGTADGLARERWGGLARPARGFSPVAIWNNMKEEGSLSQEEVVLFTQLFKSTRFWQTPEFSQDYPTVFVHTLYDIARELLQWRVKMQVVLRVARIRRGFVSRKIISRPSETSLRTSPLFSSWPSDALYRMLSALRPHAYDAGEYIFHEGEPSTSGVVIAVQGTFDEIRPVMTPVEDVPTTNVHRHRLSVPAPQGPTTERFLHLMETHIVPVTGIPRFFGDLVQVTEERHGSSITTATACDCWVLPHRVIMKEFDSLADEVQQQTLAKVLEARCNEVAATLPLTPQLLRDASPIFANASDVDLRQVLGKIHPRGVQKGEVVFTQHSTSPCCYILRHGLLHSESSTLVRRDSSPRRTRSRRSSLFRDGSPSPQKRQRRRSSLAPAKKLIEPVTAFGEQEMFFKERRRCTVTAVEVSYYYQLTYADFTAIPTLLRAACYAASEQQRKDMSRDVLLRHLARCPLLETFPINVRREILPLFNPAVYMVNELITSGSQDVEYMLVFTSGSARVRGIDASSHPDEGLVQVGESLGYTGLIPQRWRYPIVAATVVELWTLDLNDLAKYLTSATNLMPRFMKVTKQLYEYCPPPHRRASVALADCVVGRKSFVDNGRRVSTAVETAMSHRRPTSAIGQRRSTAAVQVKAIGHSVWRRCPLSSKAVRKQPKNGSPRRNTGAQVSSPLMSNREGKDAPGDAPPGFRLKKSGSIKPARGSLARAKPGDGKVKMLYHNFMVQSKQFRDACEADIAMHASQEAACIQVTPALRPARVQPPCMRPRPKSGKHRRRVSSFAHDGSADEEEEEEEGDDETVGMSEGIFLPSPAGPAGGAPGSPVRIRPATAGSVRPKSHASPSLDAAAVEQNRKVIPATPPARAGTTFDPLRRTTGTPMSGTSSAEQHFRRHRHGKAPAFSFVPRPPAAASVAAMLTADAATWAAFDRWCTGTAAPHPLPPLTPQPPPVVDVTDEVAA
eukprot:TRINITY_DN6151_c0_g1_i1.p1 TRINITY_DN6151_c0_g1~~TRINITY_DN6151_c0_g1_i1.p1  ORF type:complete len:982 (+),score=288.92 TRINITY_DN6151_c0_g1_i1:80-3025(+)